MNSKNEILVIGDIMLDAYVFTQYKGISPEAPVPVLEYSSTEYKLGGAANVMANLESLGVHAGLISVTGIDNESKILKKLLRDGRIDALILEEADRKTTVKKRIVNNDFQQYLRLDYEDRHDINKQSEKIILQTVEEHFSKGNIKAVILQDYNKGVLSRTCIQGIQDLARRYNVITFADPKRANFDLLSHCDFFKPNLKECKDHFTSDPNLELKKQIDSLLQKLNHCKNLIITLGKEGLIYKNEQGAAHLEAYPVQDPDVSGAGDTVIACLVAYWLEGKSLQKMCINANKAGAIVCSKKGISTTTRSEIEQFD